MSWRALVLVFGAAVLVSVGALWPLRWVVSSVDGLAAADVSGTVWRGRLGAAGWLGLALGDVEVGLLGGSLFSGAPAFRVEGASVEGASVEGASVEGLGVRGVVSARGVSELSGVMRFAGSEVQLEGVTLGFSEGVCEAAAGRVVLRVRGELLSGVPRCAAALVGAGAAARVEVAMTRADGVVVTTLRLGADGLSGDGFSGG